MGELIFYISGATALLATLLCITRRNAVHAVVYLINALFALALMFYYLGAPLVAAWEVIVYAGAVMVLFLFIIVMVDSTDSHTKEKTRWWHFWPLGILSLALLFCAVTLLVADSRGEAGVAGYMATPAQFGLAMFRDFGVGVEVISLLLLFALIGACYFGRDPEEIQQSREE